MSKRLQVTQRPGVHTGPANLPAAAPLSKGSSSAGPSLMQPAWARPPLSTWRKRQVRHAYILVSPALAFVTVFVLVPLGFVVYISLTNWPLIGPYHLIGLSNYRELLHNSAFFASIMFTVKYTAVLTLPLFVVGYLLAVFVRRPRRGVGVIRTVIFIPFVVGLTTESYMAYLELQPNSGALDAVLSQLGLMSASTAWTANSNLALLAICVLVVWGVAGLTMMLLMAGMQGVPADFYEAARIDGASWWQTERGITIPLIRRSIALSLIISVIGSLLAFNQFYIVTQGGPGASTQSVVMLIYETGFSQMNIGLAAAMSVLLVVAIAVISFVQFKVLHPGEAPR